MQKNKHTVSEQTVNKSCVSCSVVSDSLRPHGLQITRFHCPWDSPGKNIGVACHFLLQGNLPDQGLNLGLLCCRLILYHLSHHGSQTNHRLTVFSQMSISTSPLLRQVNFKCLPISQKTPSYCFIGPVFLFLRDLILTFNTIETRDQFYLFQKFCNEIISCVLFCLTFNIIFEK